MARVRRTGSGRAATGEDVTWSVAEGSRGRRWREVLVGEGILRHALLLETDPHGRFSHLELATPAGLLTLHPEDGDTLHGNAVRRDGIRHVGGLGWKADGCVIVDGSPIALAAAAHLLRHVLAPGASTTRTVLRIGLDLDLAVGDARIARLEADTWQIEDDPPFRVTADGIPSLVEGSSWPMEADPTG